jgi:hypothetical protein
MLSAGCLGSIRAMMCGRYKNLEGELGADEVGDLARGHVGFEDDGGDAEGFYFIGDFLLAHVGQDDNFLKLEKFLLS